MIRAQATIAVAAGLDGTALYFRDIARHLQEWDVMFLEAPGVFGEREPLTSVEALARDQAMQINCAPDIPLVLVGWSFASMVAFHMAWLLENQRTIQLVLIDPMWTAHANGSERDQTTPRVTNDAQGAAVISASHIARASYQPRRVACPCLYIVAGEGPFEVNSDLHEAPLRAAVSHVRATHYSLLTDTNAPHVARAIAECATTVAASGRWS